MGQENTTPSKASAPRPMAVTASTIRPSRPSSSSAIATIRRLGLATAEWPLSSQASSFSSTCGASAHIAVKAAAFLEATQLAGFSHEEAERFFGRPPNLKGRGAGRLTALEPMPAEEASRRYLRVSGRWCRCCGR